MVGRIEVFNNFFPYFPSFLSADSISSALLVGLREEGRRRRKEEGGGLFSNSFVELEELKVWEC